MRFLRIPQFIFGMWVALLFTLSMPFFFIIYILIFSLLPERKARSAAHNATRLWARYTFVIMFIRVKIKGKEKIDRKRVYVFVANHQSQLDIPAFMLSNRSVFRFLSKAELARIPVFGYILRKLYITVDRADKNDRSKSIQLLRKSLDEGVSVFLCPEGTRNRTKAPLIEFKDGAFRLAIEAQVPIAVLTVLDSKKRNSPRSQLELIPGTIHGIWNDIIDTKGLTLDDVSLLKNRVYGMMLRNLEGSARE